MSDNLIQGVLDSLDDASDKSTAVSHYGSINDDFENDFADHQMELLSSNPRNIVGVAWNFIHPDGSTYHGGALKFGAKQGKVSS